MVDALFSRILHLVIVSPFAGLISSYINMEEFLRRLTRGRERTKKKFFGSFVLSIWYVITYGMNPGSFFDGTSCPRTENLTSSMGSVYVEKGPSFGMSSRPGALVDPQAVS